MRPWLRLTLTACAGLFACKPGGEIPQAIVTEGPPFGAGSDLRALLVHEQRNCLYVADYYQKQIHCVDLITHSINAGAVLGTSARPLAMTMTRDGSALVVATDEPSIKIISPETAAIVSSCTLSGIPTSVIVTDKNHVYVGVDSSPASIEYCGIAPAQIASSTSLAGASAHKRIVGMHPEGTLMFTASSNLQAVNLWDMQTNTPTALDFNGFGALANYGQVVFHPGSNLASVLTDGAATHDNSLPTYAVQQTPPNISLTTSILTPTFVPNALAFLTTPARAIMTHRSRAPAWAPQHDATQKDLHVFDTASGTPLSSIALPDHVRDGGLAVDKNNVIYVLLGETTSTRMVIVTAP